MTSVFTGSNNTDVDGCSADIVVVTTISFSDVGLSQADDYSHVPPVIDKLPPNFDG